MVKANIYRIENLETKEIVEGTADALATKVNISTTTIRSYGYSE